ncbi:hypothetical protein [Streptomyces sp. 2A115]
MIHAADVREWRDLDVVDTESHKIDVLEAVYYGLPYKPGAAGERQLARR